MIPEPVYPINFYSDRKTIDTTPIYTGDADEGTERLCGMLYTYSHDNVIYVFESSEIEGEDQKLVAMCTADYYNEHFQG